MVLSQAILGSAESVMICLYIQGYLTSRGRPLVTYASSYCTALSSLIVHLHVYTQLCLLTL